MSDFDLPVVNASTEPQIIQFDTIAWEDDVPGTTGRAAQIDGARWAIVQYAAGASRADWCSDGHRGLVLNASIEYTFEDGRKVIAPRSGDACLLPAGAAHRGRRASDGPTRMFLIDDLA